MIIKIIKNGTAWFSYDSLNLYSWLFCELEIRQDGYYFYYSEIQTSHSSLQNSPYQRYLTVGYAALLLHDQKLVLHLHVQYELRLPVIILELAVQHDHSHVVAVPVYQVEMIHLIVEDAVVKGLVQKGILYLRSHQRLHDQHLALEKRLSHLPYLQVVLL